MKWLQLFAISCLAVAVIYGLSSWFYLLEPDVFDRPMNIGPAVVCLVLSLVLIAGADLYSWIFDKEDQANEDRHTAIAFTAGVLGLIALMWLTISATVTRQENLSRQHPQTIGFDEKVPPTKSITP